MGSFPDISCVASSEAVGMPPGVTDRVLCMCVYVQTALDPWGEAPWLQDCKVVTLGSGGRAAPWLVRLVDV